MRESEVQAYLFKRWRSIGGLPLKFVSPGRRGVSDCILLYPGAHVWFVEVKTEKGQLSGLQKLFAEEIAALGFKPFTLYGRHSVDQFIEATLDLIDILAGKPVVTCENCGTVRRQTRALCPSCKPN